MRIEPKVRIICDYCRVEHNTDITPPIYVEKHDEPQPINNSNLLVGIEYRDICRSCYRKIEQALMLTFSKVLTDIKPF